MTAVVLAIVTTFAAVAGTTIPAGAQPPADSVRDILSDIYAPIDHSAPIDVVRGSVVEHREATLVLRGDDGRVHTINTAGLDAAAMARLHAGSPVMVALKSGSPGAMPIASAVEAIEIQPSAAVPGRLLDRVHGSVERIGLGRVTLRTDAGVELTVETTQLTTAVQLRPGDVVTVIGTMAQGTNPRFRAEEIFADRPRAPVAPPADR
jgi:hypothetical protein